MFPDFIFETSWEVCNNVGGIYTVLSTRAKTMQDKMRDKVIFIGPDCWQDKANPFFIEDVSLFQEWKEVARQSGLHVRIGRWSVPGSPIAFLVDSSPFSSRKNSLYGKLWEDYGVDSLHAYGDYDESALFSYAVALTVESFYQFYLTDTPNVLFHANEWQTGFAVLFLQKLLPQIASIFTTHATCIGRSIAGNNKPLYEYLSDYNGDQMAFELNMQSKHSIEKQTAHHADCFTTVSDITAKECRELLDKPVDVVLPNGFEDNFIPRAIQFNNKRKAARQRLVRIANALTGTAIDNDALIISTSGRYEFRNKGIDVFIEAVSRLNNDTRLRRNVLAFIKVPGWVAGPRKDLQERLTSDREWNTPLEQPHITHWLYDMDNDKVLNMMRHLNIRNEKDDKVKLIFIPSYLIGEDGILNLSYYDMVLGNDLCVFPSYYEPWGYTPLESVAFKVPCITTDLSGFGLWADKTKGGNIGIEDGVQVIHRTDYNYSDVADAIKNTILRFSTFDKVAVNKCRRNACLLSSKALWKEFFCHYERAYATAFENMRQRVALSEH